MGALRQSALTPHCLVACGQVPFVAAAAHLASTDFQHTLYCFLQTVQSFCPNNEEECRLIRSSGADLTCNAVDDIALRLPHFEAIWRRCRGAAPASIRRPT